MKYELLQVREPRMSDVAFRPYDAARGVDLADYHETHAGTVAGFASDEAALEELFRRFNIDHPADFKSYSLSMADLVRLDGARLYYCDTFGWKQVP